MKGRILLTKIYSYDLHVKAVKAFGSELANAASATASGILCK